MPIRPNKKQEQAVTDEAFKKVLLYTFKDFIRLCEKHNLRYYAAFGTVLGAVRHQGFIPWDDDIDVYMPYEDYKRFLALRDKLDNTGYRIIDIDTKGYFIYFAKFSNCNTTLIEKMGQIDVGIYIDVFPLYNYEEQQCKYLIKYNKYYFWLWFAYAHSQRRYSLHQFHSCWMQKNFRQCRIIIADTLLFRILSCPTRFLIKQYLKRLAKVSKTSKVWRYSYNIGESNVMPWEWFAEGKNMKFEDIQIRVPKEYDSYLTSNYGDYMTPPPPQQRGGKHSRYSVKI